MPTANERLFDLEVSHQIQVRRFLQGEVKRVLNIIAQQDKALADKLRATLNQSRTQKRLLRLFDEIKNSRKLVWQEFRDQVRKDLIELATIEGQAELAILQDAVPFNLDLTKIEGGLARSAVLSRPFQGKLLNEWFRDLEISDRVRLKATLTQGIVEGKTTQSIVREIVGSRANDFTDGVLAVSRRQATALVRTATNHVANRAREDVWDANGDIISSIRWSSVLDGRTSAICRSRDGKHAKVSQPLPNDVIPLVPQGARPPAHVNCRSIMIPVFDGIGVVGEKPFVLDARNPRNRLKDFRADAKKAVGDKRWKELSPKQRNSLTAKERNAWQKQNIGTVPAETTYDQFLRRQSASFQDEVLGETKGALYRRGGVTLDQFVDRAGNELTIAQLRDKVPNAFKQIGL